MRAWRGACHQTSQSQPNLISSSSGVRVSEGGDEWIRQGRTLKFIFAHVDGRRGVDDFGCEVIDHVYLRLLSFWNVVLSDLKGRD